MRKTFAGLVTLTLIGSIFVGGESAQARPVTGCNPMISVCTFPPPTTPPTQRKLAAILRCLEHHHHARRWEVCLKRGS